LKRSTDINNERGVHRSSSTPESLNLADSQRKRHAICSHRSCRGKIPDCRRAIGDVVDVALLTVNLPKDDWFEAITEHAPGDLILDPAYLGIERSAGCLFIKSR
jgi:hypothetical protein